MDITRNDNGTYTISNASGTIQLSMNDASLFLNQFMKNGLRESIEYETRKADGDTIDMTKYPYTFEEFIDEIFTDMEDEIDYGNYPSDKNIQDKITDTADFYEMLIEE